MVDTHDPAGWYPDPTGNHELRYWDGYAWMDDVSDHGAAGKDPLGGTPLPPPSQVAARQQQAAAPAPASTPSRTPVIIAAVVVAVLVIGGVVFFLTRSSGSGTATLKDKPVTFSDDGKNSARPTVHRLNVVANTAVLVKVTADSPDTTLAVVILTNDKVVNSVRSQISDASDLFSDQLKSSCSNLREEDIGAKGNTTYSTLFATDVGKTLNDFTIFPVAGEFEFVPVAIDKNGDCKAVKLTMTLTPKPLDLKSASNLSDVESVVSDDSQLSSLLEQFSS